MQSRPTPLSPPRAPGPVGGYSTRLMPLAELPAGVGLGSDRRHHGRVDQHGMQVLVNPLAGCLPVWLCGEHSC
jgi:hypothetical protein